MECSLLQSVAEAIGVRSGDLVGACVRPSVVTRSSAVQTPSHIPRLWLWSMYYHGLEQIEPQADPSRSSFLTRIFLRAGFGAFNSCYRLHTPLTPYQTPFTHAFGH